jgi:hypothetical protein
MTRKLSIWKKAIVVQLKTLPTFFCLAEETHEHIPDGTVGRYKVRVKVKHSRYRPGVSHRVPGSTGSQIS